MSHHVKASAEPPIAIHDEADDLDYIPNVPLPNKQATQDVSQSSTSVTTSAAPPEAKAQPEIVRTRYGREIRKPA